MAPPRHEEPERARKEEAAASSQHWRQTPVFADDSYLKIACPMPPRELGQEWSINRASYCIEKKTRRPKSKNTGIDRLLALTSSSP